MALQSNADLRLLNGLLPVISISFFFYDLTVPRPHLRFPNYWRFLRWGRQPHAQPPTWRIRSPYLYPLETGWPSYTPRHWVPVLVAFYDMHGLLQWDYPTGAFLPTAVMSGTSYEADTLSSRYRKMPDDPWTSFFFQKWRFVIFRF
jgi:hypothetical protein